MTAPILVTGATGFIGSAVKAALERLAIPTIGVTHGATPSGGGKSGWIHADLARGLPLEELAGVGGIVHTAAAIPSTFEDSERHAKANRAIDANVLSTAASVGAPLVYASSMSVYGDAGPEPVTEQAPLAGRGPYLEEKAWAERQGLAQARDGKLRFTALRVNAPYGPGQDRPTVINTFIDRALGGGTLEYFGSGAREQDFTYVDDVADAFVKALDGPGGVFNIAGGEPTTMKDLGVLVARLAGRGEDSVRAAGVADPQENRRARYDTSAAREALGWEPAASLEQGIVRCIAASKRAA